MNSKQLMILVISVVSLKTFCTEIDCSKEYALEQVIEQRYQPGSIAGLELSIDLYDCDVEKIRTAPAIKEYILTVCKLLKLRTFDLPTIAHFSENKKATGYSFILHAAQGTFWGRFSNHNNRAIISIFLHDIFNAYKITELTRHYFHAKKFKAKAKIKTHDFNA